MNKTGKIAIILVVVVALVLAVTVVSAKPGAKVSPRAAKICSDGIDNDGDNYTDYPADPGCSSKNDKSELNTNIECDDGTDNDADTFVDYPDDPGCTGPSDDDEYNAPPVFECNDEVDNDGDNQTDYPNDAGCASSTDDDETNCGDGVCEGGETSGTCLADCGYADSCYDTDGGFVLIIQGMTFGYSNNQFYNDTDYCVNSTALTEYFCTGDQEFSSVAICGGNATCVSGACF